MTVESVLTKVSESTGIPVEVITGHSRQRKHVEARYLAILLIRRNLRLSQQEIAPLFDIDRTSVYHAIKTVKGWLDVDFDIQEKLNGIEPEISTCHV